MFERFTEKAIKVIMLAQEEARRLGHNFVGTEQILLGLIGEGTGIGPKVLKSMGVNLKDARYTPACTFPQLDHPPVRKGFLFRHVVSPRLACFVPYRSIFSYRAAIRSFEFECH